uniref:PB1 domain-containing protein n=1 Tax=Haemonchus contortus TaxID=6289 RepID=A0A7I4Z737_HAECO
DSVVSIACLTASTADHYKAYLSSIPYSPACPPSTMPEQSSSEPKSLTVKLQRRPLRFTISYRDQHELVREFRRNLQRLGIPLESIFWMDEDCDPIRIDSADTLQNAAMDTSVLRLHIRNDHEHEHGDISCPSCDEFTTHTASRCRRHPRRPSHSRSRSRSHNRTHAHRFHSRSRSRSRHRSRERRSHTRNRSRSHNRCHRCCHSNSRARSRSHDRHHGQHHPSRVVMEEHHHGHLRHPEHDPLRVPSRCPVMAERYRRSHWYDHFCDHQYGHRSDHRGYHTH